MSATALVAGARRRRRILRRRLTPFNVLSALVALFIAALAIYPLGDRSRADLLHRRPARPVGPAADARRAGPRHADQEHADRGRRQLGDRARHRRCARVGERADRCADGPAVASRSRSSRSSSRRSPARPPGCCCCRPAPGFVNYWLRDVLGWFGIERVEGPLNIYSFGGLLLVYTVYQVPYAFMLITAGLRNIDPALEEASRVSGAGLLRTLRQVTLPAVDAEHRRRRAADGVERVRARLDPARDRHRREHPRPLGADRPGAAPTSRPTRASRSGSARS